MSKTRFFPALAVAFAVVAAGSSAAYADPAATPSVAVSPSSGLADGATVSVAATGFTAGAAVTVWECAGGATGPVCDTGSQAATTGADGTVSTSFVVHRVLTTASGPVDCTTVANGCFVGVADESYSEVADAVISFG
ncbi:Neocarzinostatin family protein [Amycolatopsis tolypomycina]|uniref:Neocarzinostatin family protein n=1 Tax=Amycolatopsis tolypomycina TaxID=208445 RepID=A0A1H4TVY8_9PSEU|nr:enediyne antibiotic chromoprotein [Amycolatopsis tolypomycina]SEC60645.1 Neocarzinostatin family protein [Amycolatopsis tolypomycina]